MKKILSFILFFIIVVFIFGIRIYKLHLSDNGSMQGTLNNNDLFLANRFIYFISTPKRGDLIVFADPTLLSNNFLYKLIQINIYGSTDRPSRIIASPGDSIKSVIENNNVSLYLKKSNENNFNKLNEKYITQKQQTISQEDIFEYNLKNNEYWLMSDNRENKIRDSRYFGPIQQKYISGRLFLKISKIN